MKSLKEEEKNEIIFVLAIIFSIFSLFVFPKFTRAIYTIEVPVIFGSTVFLIYAFWRFNSEK